MQHRILNKIVALCAGTMLATSISAPLSANASERNLVAFGDSVIADPRADIYLNHQIASGLAPDRVNPDRCPTSATNYAKRAGAKLGLPVSDFSCAGATSMSGGKPLSTQVDWAIKTGALSSATKRVIFASGFNDTYNNANLSQKQMRARFVKFTAPLVERIKRAAPNARIQIVGYSTITDQGNVCLVNGQAPVPLHIIKHWEDSAQWMQVDLARATGTEFLDLKPSTVGRGMCSPDNKRMWASVIDFTGGPSNLPFHLNARGQAHVANVIARS